MHSRVPEHLLSQLGRRIAAEIGLNVPEAHSSRLNNAILAGARQSGWTDPEAWIQNLLASPWKKSDMDLLVSILTVGETYFFRDPHSFNILENRLLPELIRARQGRNQRLRIWIAGCCTGEEPYSIAILLTRLIADLRAWDITILATDINRQFLQKASDGVYGRWSFRCTPAWVKDRYFRPAQDGKFGIVQHVKDLVTFACLNLAVDVYPSLSNNTTGIDLILCRNVLMYFTEDCARRVVANLHQSLVAGGWLMVTPTEMACVPRAGFGEADFKGGIFQKFKIQNAAIKVAEAQLPASARPGLSSVSSPLKKRPVRQPDASAMARRCANEGRLEEALAWCTRAIASDRMNPGLNYLRGTILQEAGRIEEAVISLKRVLYLDPDFVLAHFLLGNLARDHGRPVQSAKHFENALELLCGYRQDDVLPESGGLTAGALAAMIGAREIPVEKP
jgi:chemotaxis protein methyltransferase CheR